MARIKLADRFSEKFACLDEAAHLMGREAKNLQSLNEQFRENSTDYELIEALDQIGEIVRKQVMTDGYAHLSGIPQLQTVAGFTALCNSVGTLFDDLTYQRTAVVQATPTPSATLQGNRTSRLPLHTDYAMLEHPPIITAIWCRREDPGGAVFGRNGLCSATDLVSSIFGTSLMDRLENTNFPFSGKNGEGKLVEHWAPILAASRSPDRLSEIRFHPSRIFFGNRMSDSPIGTSEFELMREFRDVCARCRQDLYLKQGDVLFLNNRSTLHDRTECSLKWDGIKYTSRVSEIAFIEKLREPLTGDCSP